MTKLSTIKALLEEPFTGKLNVDKNETAQDVKDRHQRSKKFDRLGMDQKLTRLMKQHRASLVATQAAAKSSIPDDKKQPHLQRSFENLEEMLLLSVSIMRQLELEQETLQKMISKTPAEPEAAPEQTDTPPAAQKVE